MSVALCIVYPPHKRPERRFGKAMVREGDGKPGREAGAADQCRTKLSRTKMASGTVRNARRFKKGPKIAAFAGLISDRAELSETVRIHPTFRPTAQQAADQPVKTFVTKY